MRFFCAAYLASHKGIPELLQAAALLNGMADLAGRWSLAIAGDGVLQSRIEEQIAEGRFGWRRDVPWPRAPSPYHQGSCRCGTSSYCPSRWPENEPVILLEAIAAGRAQLATNIGGVPQLVEAGVTGDPGATCGRGGRSLPLWPAIFGIPSERVDRVLRAARVAARFSESAHD